VSRNWPITSLAAGDLDFRMPEAILENPLLRCTAQEMEVMVGWFLVTIMAPLITPVIGLLILRVLAINGVSADDAKVMSTVKNGQLGWTAIAMGSSALYELWGMLAAGNPAAWEGWALAGLVVMMAAAMLIAAGGSLAKVELRTTTGEGITAWTMHYRIFALTAVMAAITAFLYTYIHFSAVAKALRDHPAAVTTLEMRRLP
jgi:hypothetical protein